MACSVSEQRTTVFGAGEQHIAVFGTGKQRTESERKAYCSICGKEMSVYDADIMSADGNEAICQECLKKTLKNQ